jgi:Fe-S-cluster-containing dehydrogenase component
MSFDDARRPMRRSLPLHSSAEQMSERPRAGRDLEHEFAPDVTDPRDWDLGRRELLKLLGASAALAGLGACAQRPREKILPYSEQPVEIHPGLPLFYATSMSLDGFAVGLLAKTHEGRPTKLEGNPDHPASGGASHAFAQASILELYDPARLAAPKHRGQLSSWPSTDRSLIAAMRDSARPWFVMPPQSSAVVGALVARIRERYPAARFTFRSPVSRAPVYRAADALFGRALETQYDFGRARVVLALDADFLSAMPMSLRWARDWAERRRRLDREGAMSRLYVAETMPSPTGSVADHRVPLPPSQIGQLAAALLSRILPSVNAGAGDLVALAQKAASAFTWPGIDALARDLRLARGESIVVAGPEQPLVTHVFSALLNAALGNVGSTVWYTEPALLAPDGGDSISELSLALGAGAVDSVAFLDVNPLYDAPPELGLARALRRAKHTFHWTYFENETSRACEVVLPAAHYLESWGDGRAYDGTWSSVQPLIAPLKPARNLLEILALFAGDPSSSGHALLREYWAERLGPDFDAGWEARLRRGCDAVSDLARLTPAPNWTGLAAAVEGPTGAPTARGLELNFEVSPSVYDGRFGNNAWLQELPHPVTKQCWGNAAILSPASARRLGVESGRILRLGVGGARLEVPALVLNGHAEHALTLALGYGRAGSEQTAEGVGANAFLLRGKSEPGFVQGVEVRATERREPLALTQQHFSTEERPLALRTDVESLRKHPDFAAHERGPQASWLPPDRFNGTQWAMSIDTMTCTGCGSCVVACQAENNVPVVGKEGVQKSREMHWLRIDRYLSDGPGGSAVVNLPMLCQHCEKAPCEYVCPVNATVHSPDGLNEMVYNRCVGTRFCSNNCPYKVRRFNFFEYTADGTSRELQRNPEVTVRERGVMEKCTFCVQRIRHAEIRARVERRGIRAGEVVTACQQACATGAIQFGSLEHESTPVVTWRREARAYEALHELNTRPRVMYLASVENPNPELPK